MRSRWLWLVVALAAGLRFFPIWFGLPFPEARPDEETAVGHAVAILDGDLNPHFFHWPSFTFYLFAACFKMASWVRRLTVNDEYLIARGLVAAAGTSTIVVLFRLSRRVADDATALVASLFLTVAILHVRDSHFAMTDVLMTLLVTIALALLVRGLDEGGSAGWFAAAGVAGGLAASTKYSAAAVIAAALVAQLLAAGRSGRQAWTPFVAFVSTFGLGFIAATPYALLDYAAFADGLSFDFAHLSAGHSGNLGVGWIYHLTRSLPNGLGLPLFLTAVAGVVPLVRRGRAAVVLGAFAAALYAAIGSGHTVFFRYVLPLVPIACLSAAVAVREGGVWLARRTARSPRVVVGIVAAAVAAPALVNSVWFDVLLARTDTRVEAGRWLAERATRDEAIYSAGGAYAEAELFGVRAHVWTTQSFDPATSTFKNAGDRIPDWLVLPQSPLKIYTRVPEELRTLAARRYDVAYVVRATRGREEDAVYDPEDAFFMPVAGFQTVLRPGPTIVIYRRRGLK